jgi:hypothetical protein
MVSPELQGSKKRAFSLEKARCGCACWSSTISSARALSSWGTNYPKKSKAKYKLNNERAVH